MVQTAALNVSDAFHFTSPLAAPAFTALATSAPVAVRSSFLEIRTGPPLLEVLAHVPYRCVWSRTVFVPKAGVPGPEVVSPTIAYSGQVMRCRIPVTSSPRNAALRV